jgi:hypothetical protein
MLSCLMVCVSPYRIVSVYIGQSQHVKGERAVALGWEPKRVPVVIEEWAEEGVKAALEKL